MLGNDRSLKDRNKGSNKAPLQVQTQRESRCRSGGGSRPIRLRCDDRRSKKGIENFRVMAWRMLFFQKSRPAVIGTGRERAIDSLLRPDRLGNENSTSEWTMDTRIAVIGKCVVASLSYSRSLRQGRDYPLPDPVRWGEIIKWSLIGWHKNSMAEP